VAMEAGRAGSAVGLSFLGGRCRDAPQLRISRDMFFAGPPFEETRQAAAAAATQNSNNGNSRGAHSRPTAECRKRLSPPADPPDRGLASSDLLEDAADRPIAERYCAGDRLSQQLQDATSQEYPGEVSTIMQQSRHPLDREGREVRRGAALGVVAAAGLSALLKPAPATQRGARQPQSSSSQAARRVGHGNSRSSCSCRTTRTDETNVRRQLLTMATETRQVSTGWR
jgi:hypothetical protein